jgi:hypothetical protein
MLLHWSVGIGCSHKRRSEKKMLGASFYFSQLGLDLLLLLLLLLLIWIWY